MKKHVETNLKENTHLHNLQDQTQKPHYLYKIEIRERFRNVRNAQERNELDERKKQTLGGVSLLRSLVAKLQFEDLASSPPLISLHLSE